MLCTCPQYGAAHHPDWCVNTEYSASVIKWRTFEQITLADWARR